MSTVLHHSYTHGVQHESLATHSHLHNDLIRVFSYVYNQVKLHHVHSTWGGGGTDLEFIKEGSFHC